MSPRSIFFLCAVLAVAAAFPAEPSQDKEESGEEQPQVRDARFLDRLGVPSSLSNRIQNLSSRLSNSDRSTISRLLSTLSDNAQPQLNLDTILHYVSSAMGN